MMKYLPNHTKDFSAPVNAFVVGLLQCMAGLATELACIFYLGTINTPIDVIIRFIALGSIAKVDDFYYNALPSENRVLGKVPELTVKLQRRDMRESKDKKVKYYAARFVYKTFRLVYASFVFYFFPYTTLLAPYLFRATTTA